MLIILLGAGLSGNLMAQAEMQLVQDDLIKVKHVKPPSRNFPRYLDSNKPKKKFKAHIKMVHGSDCPTYLHYYSKPQAKRDKIIDKRKRFAQGHFIIAKK